MTERYEVRFDPEALAAIDETTEYIQEQASPERALRWLRAMRQGIQQLETHPRAFGAVAIRRGQSVHSKLVLSHRVYYFIDDIARRVYVLDIVHTARETKLAEYRE